METEHARVVVVVVSFNGAGHIGHCLQSLLESEYSVDHIVVVDNASRDSTVRILRSKFSNVQLIALDENIGFGPANNLGIQYALGKHCDYVFLLNQDAYVEPDTIGGMISVYSKNTSFGILSPLHLFEDGKLDVNFRKYLSEIDPTFFEDVLLDRAMKEVYSLPFVNAAAWLLSRECLDTVGGFDPLLEHFGGDDDYARRVLYHGYEIGICPHLKLFHKRSQEDRSWSSYESFIRCRDLTALKNLNASIGRATFTVAKRQFLRIAYHIKEMDWGNLRSSIRNTHHLARLWFLILKHRNRSRLAGRAFLNKNEDVTTVRE